MKTKLFVFINGNSRSSTASALKSLFRPSSIRSTRSTSPKSTETFSVSADNPGFQGISPKSSDLGSGRGSGRGSDLSTDEDIAWCEGRRPAVSKEDLPRFLKAMDLDEYKSAIFPLAESRFVDENFLFLEEVKKFKVDPTLKRATKIYDTFVDQSGDKQVNLKGENRTDIEEAIDAHRRAKDYKVNKNLFDTGAIEIIGMVIDDVIRKYCSGQRTFGKRRRRSHRRRSHGRRSHRRRSHRRRSHRRRSHRRRRSKRT